MPAIYHEGSWLGNATDPEVLVKDTVGWTGKNLLKNTAVSQTINGVTFTVNSDKSVRVVANNTSVYSALTLNSNLAEILEVGQSYVLTGTSIKPSGTSYRQYELRIRKNSNNDIVASDKGSGVKFTLTQAMVQADTYRLDIAIFDGTTCDTIFYPMLRKADITDPTYEPYHESVQNQLNAQGVLGAKNLLPNNATSQTINGVTFTVNSDKSVTVNGTATAEALFNIHRYLIDIKLSGNLILNGCPTGGTNTTYQLYLQRRNAENTGWDTPIYRDFGDGVNVTIEDGRLFDVVILIRNGATLNNLVFKPMLRLASDPDDTYQPRAMTNRELTEKGIGEKHTATITTGTTGNWASTHTISAIRRIEAYAKGYIIIPFVNASGTWFLKVLSIDMQPVASQSIEVTYWTFAV